MFLTWTEAVKRSFSQLCACQPVPVTSPNFKAMYQQTRSYKSVQRRGMVSGLHRSGDATIDHLNPPDLPRHGCNSDRGPAASGGPTVLANDRNGGRLRLNVSRHDDDNATPVPADDDERVATALKHWVQWRTTDEDADVTRRISRLLRCWPTQAVISSHEETEHSTQQQCHDSTNIRLHIGNTIQLKWITHKVH